MAADRRGPVSSAAWPRACQGRDGAGRTAPALAGLHGPAPSDCLTDHQVIESVEQLLGNGVTVAQRLSDQAIEIAYLVLQTAPISIRPFPVVSERFAKLSAVALWHGPFLFVRHHSLPLVV
jgi:hypothetical protein